MRIHIFLFFSAILSISACQNITSENQSVPPTVLSPQQFSEILQQHTWSYTPPNSDTPIQINFNNDDIIVYSGCNLMSQKYKTKDNQIMLFDHLLSSTKGCGELTKQEIFSYGLFLQPASFTLEKNPTAETVLKLESNDHKIYTFKATFKKENLEQNNLEYLQQYTWAYTPPNSTMPILANISSQGTHIYSGCNQISKTHTLNGNHLKTNPVQIQTLMGCGGLQSQEALACRIFTDSNLEIQTFSNDQKYLKVSLKNGAVYSFQAIPAISDLKNYDIEILKKFTWQHISDEPSPDQIKSLLINFTADRMLFFAGCNRKSQYYAIENKTLIPKGDFRSQVKFCGNTQHERQTSQSMSKPMNIRFDFSTLFPKLILESKYQPNMIFQAIPRKEDLKSP